MLNINYSGFEPEVGVDESGRGCLCGPVVAAAVILPTSFNHPLLNDSKKVSKKNRITLRKYIEENSIDFRVSFINSKQIDKLNILQASIKAMHMSILKLKHQPKFIIVDGNKFIQFKKIPHKTIIKGDAKYMSISAASILAKTYRDEFMEKIHIQHPEYNWKENKGYPTKQHRKAISNFGITKYHRKSFKLLSSQLSLNLDKK